MGDVISATTNADAKQFDFLEGEWNAICRFPLPDGSWGEGPGSLTTSKVLDGCVSLELEGPYQGAIIKGLGFRAFNPQTSQWEHTWTDTSAPGGFLVWRVRFEGNAIDLHGQWEDERAPDFLAAHLVSDHRAVCALGESSLYGWRQNLDQTLGD